MVKRTEAEWRGLFEEQAHSGMTQRHFCLARRLCPKYFSLRKKQLGWKAMTPSPSPFVRVERAHPVTPQSTPCVVVRLGRCEWELRDVSADWLVTLMKALA